MFQLNFFKFLMTPILVVGAFLVTAVAVPKTYPTPTKTPLKTIESPSILTQVGTITSLEKGVFEGNYSYAKLTREGNFGIGALNQLNGEMVASYGHFYQVATTGQLRPILPTETAPFAEVTFFRPQESFRMSNIETMNEINKELEENIKNKNIPYAVRITGWFSQMKIRTVEIQNKPNTELASVAKGQNILDLKNVKGVLIGFWFPKYLSNIGTGGLHTHFIAMDHSVGGHVLEAAVESGEVSIQPLYQIQLDLTNLQRFPDINLGKTKKKAHAVSSSKAGASSESSSTQQEPLSKDKRKGKAK